MTADQTSTGGANKAAICTEMETKRAISASLSLSAPPAVAGPRPGPKRLTRRCQGGGTPAGRLAQTGQRSPVEVVSGGVLDGWVVSSERKSIGIV